MSKLHWQCRRGVKELDVVLSGYLENHYETADKTIQQAFEQLLELEDPQLLGLVYGDIISDDGDIQSVVEQLRIIKTI